VTLPNATTSHARIKVEAVGNVYFDVNHADFAIAPAATTTTLTADYATTVYGHPVTFTATVASVDPVAPTPSGNVQLYLDGAPAGAPVALNGAGVATWTTSAISLGTHTLTAPYSAASASTDYTAAVTALAPGAGIVAGGTVQFKIDGTNLGAPVTVVAGSATLHVNWILPTGNHVVRAVYSGDSSFLTSTGPTTIQHINP
jgi:hypothetical protein